MKYPMTFINDLFEKIVVQFNQNFDAKAFLEWGEFEGKFVLLSFAISLVLFIIRMIYNGTRYGADHSFESAVSRDYRDFVLSLKVFAFVNMAAPLSLILFGLYQNHGFTVSHNVLYVVPGIVTGWGITLFNRWGK